MYPMGKYRKTAWIFLPLVSLAIVSFLAETGMGQTYSYTPYLKPRALTRPIPVVSGRNGVVAASTAVAPSIGLKVLMDGGNAVDAAVTTAAMLTVHEFSMCGIGGHGIMMLYVAKTGEVKCLDWGGFLPRKFTIDQWGTPPTPPMERNPLCTILPGTLAGWSEALNKHGTISLAKALEPAIKYAEEGIAVTPREIFIMERFSDLIELFPEASRIWMPQGRIPKIGETLKFTDLANTYRRIAKEGPDVYYKGELADKIVKYLNENGSRFTKEEFANYKPIWRDTLNTIYRGQYKIFTPKNQNFSPVILTMFNIWENFDMKKLGLLTPEEIHLVIEAQKIAFADRSSYYGDPDFTKVPYEILTSKAYGKRMAERIDMRKASPEVPGDLKGLEGATTNLAVVDKEGNVCFITQTLGAAFGSMHIVPGTGVTLNNEGKYFDLKPAHGPNYPAGGKRVENQMGASIITKDGKFWAGMGTSGGTRIPLDIASGLMRMIDHNLRIQEAIEVPRVTYVGNGIAQIERGVQWQDLEKLWQMGHKIQVPLTVCPLSGIKIDPETGAFEGGADPDANFTRVAY